MTGKSLVQDKIFYLGYNLIQNFIYTCYHLGLSCKLSVDLAFNLIMMPFSGSLSSFISLVDFGRH